MNEQIIQAKQDILNCINSELSQGVPVAALVLILESILPNLEQATNQVIQQERDAKIAEENSNEEAVAELQESQIE